MPAIYIKRPAPDQGAARPMITLPYTENIDGHAVFTIPQETLMDMLALITLTGCEVHNKQV